MATSLFDLFGKIVLDDSEYNKGVDAAESRMSKFGGFLKNGLKTAAKIGTAVTAVGTAAVVGLSKQAVDAYATFEQLEGGVEKLYGEGAEQIKKYAAEAYKTSGKSANEYMESATGFSAALIKSLNGDMQKAAELTDVAMRLMSDNVNTFGSDAESVQNAIMGISRNNFTLIDNLKLGYAGTAQGMLELINDSGVLGYTLKDTSELANVGFANMILAIQKIQEEQGIAGTTAKEAMLTIEGSATATKKAWQNVITAIGGGGDIGKAIDGLISSIFGENEGEGLVNQLVPRIEQTMKGVGKLIVKAAPIIGEKLPALASALLPSLVSSVGSLISSLAVSLPELITMLTAQLPDIVNLIVNTILELTPLILDLGLQVILALAQGLTENLPELIPKVVDVVLQITNTLIDNVDLLIDGAIALIIGLATGLINALPLLIEKIPEIVIKIVNAFIENAPKILEAGATLVMLLIQGISNLLPTLWEKSKEAGSGIIDRILEWFKKLPENIGYWLGQAIATLIKWGIEAIAWVRSEVPKIIQQVTYFFMTLPGKIYDVLKNLPAKMIEIGYNIVTGIWNGIKNATGWLTKQISGFASGVLNGFMSAFGIHSPSTLMRDLIGINLAKGVGVGFIDEMGKIEGDMQDAIPTDFEIKANTSVNGGYGINGGGSGVYELLESYLPQILASNRQDILLDGRIISATVDRRIGGIYEMKARAN